MSASPPAQFSFVSLADGWRITGYRWPVEGRPAANVVISHGLAEHAGRYARFAAALNAAGFSVHAPDHRAHGRTLGPNGFGDFGPGGWDALVADLDQLVDRIRLAEPDVPVILFGHSMGAAAAQQFVQHGSHKITALVLSGTTARRPGEELGDYNAAFEPARTPYDWLSRDSAEVDAYLADPLCGFEGQTIRNGFDRSDPRRVDPQRLAKIRPDLPVLLVAGDADPVNRRLAGLKWLETLWRDAGVRHIDTRYYPGGRHEMLNEINRDEVTRDILEWLYLLTDATAPLASFDASAWTSVNDDVMGGRSTSVLSRRDDGIRFHGVISLEDGGGFASVRSELLVDLAAASGLRLTVRGDGRRYQLRLRADADPRSVAYRHTFATDGTVQHLELPFEDFTAVFRGRHVDSAEPLAPGAMRLISFMTAEHTPGWFRLDILRYQRAL